MTTLLKAKNVRIRWFVGSISSGWILTYQGPSETYTISSPLMATFHTTDPELLWRARKALEIDNLEIPEDVEIER